MFGKVGIVQKVLAPEEEPENRWCKSGHTAPDEWTPKGADEPRPCRMVAISGPDIPEHLAGVYCEPCIATANKIARHKKDRRKSMH